jgi:DNA (cytosine-5)-methyltransferase 1
MRIIFGLDNDHDSSETFRLNFPEASFIEKDIRDVRPEEIAEKIGIRPGPLLISACAPCQPYSTFASANRHDPKRELLLCLIPIVKLLKPELILIENVPGLRRGAASGDVFNKFHEALGELHYYVGPSVIDCQAYGVPQRRRRLVIMASLLGPVELPRPTHGTAKGLLPVSTVREWIADLPPLIPGQSHPNIPNHIASGLTDLNRKRLRATPEGGGRADWPEDLKLACHANHRGHSDVYGRMRFDAPAPALTTKCTSISNGRFGHPVQDRPISVREAACLQTFPRDYVFVGGIKSATRQVGNAVPVILAKQLGETFNRHIGLSIDE